MRLDKFLFFTRFTKTRSLAQALVHNGKVRVDGRATQACSASILPGMVITLAINDRVRAIQVYALPERRGPAQEAQSCYCDLLSEAIDARPIAI